MKGIINSKKRIAGQGMTEYIIITALIAVAAIGVYSMFGKTVRHQMAGMAQEMAGKSSSAELSSAQSTAANAAKVADTDVTLGNYDEAATKAIE